MIIAKDKLEYIVSTMPDNVDVEEVFDRILLMAKIQQARKQIEEGNFLSEEDMDKEIDSWD
ncbi:hypothetical protein EOD41_07395 [Mucilaginibacter limnophilus]|uniref:Uncharacterized protein n=1 Tax=Mucilaginibacter limnophilus TaxID=1932778 RepID=A0A3S2Y291_9SPHI|nr:hypothetical protein [Mucilaginibacter limnophilus]RVU01774.1 hypothetical protein EOD41_07395 [Mucilaginibacter limnophilus]